MDKKLADFFPWHPRCNLLNQFILCLDRNPTGGEFVFDLLLACYLQKNYRVVLVALNHSSSHFESILQKQALNSTRLHAEGLLQVRALELNKSVGERQAELNDLLREVSADATPKGAAASPTVVMIDDLLALDLYAGCCRTARAAMVSLLGLLFDQRIGGLVAYGKAYCEPTCPMMTQPFSFNVDAANDSDAKTNGGAGAPSYASGEDEGDVPLYAQLAYQADVSVYVAPLNTGYALDVHGQISIVSGYRSGGQGGGVLSAVKGALRTNNLIYKALDTGVTCCAVASDS